MLGRKLVKSIHFYGIENGKFFDEMLPQWAQFSPKPKKNQLTTSYYKLHAF